MSSQVTTAPERKSERKGSTDAHIMIDRISLGNAASSPYASQYVSQTECCVSVLIGLIQWFSGFFLGVFFATNPLIFIHWNTKGDRQGMKEW